MEIAPLQRRIEAEDVPPERLAGNPRLTEKEKIAEASRQFEAVLLKQILDSTQKTVIQSKFADNSTSAGIYRDLVTTQLADSISKSGAFGLAKTFEHQLDRPPVAASTAGSDGTHVASHTSGTEAAGRPHHHHPKPHAATEALSILHAHE